MNGQFLGYKLEIFIGVSFKSRESTSSVNPRTEQQKDGLKRGGACLNTDSFLAPISRTIGKKMSIPVKISRNLG